MVARRPSIPPLTCGTNTNTKGTLMLGRFQPAALEPRDDAEWHLAMEQYETSGDLRADALDWLVKVLEDAGTADLTDEQKATVDEWYRDSNDFDRAFEERLMEGSER